jgi:hypothetical protein
MPRSCRRKAPPRTNASAGLSGKSSPQISDAVSHSESTCTMEWSMNIGMETLISPASGSTVARNCR